MAIIAGMETATVDDVTPFELPTDDMAKGILSKQKKYDDTTNEIADKFADLQTDLRDRQEDWDTFDGVRKNMADELKRLEDAAGGDWSQIPKSEISKIALNHVNSNEMRQLKTAYEQAKAFETQKKEFEKAGKDMYHFGIDPMNASLYNEDGTFRDFRDVELFAANEKEVFEFIDTMSDKLGESEIEDFIWTSIYSKNSGISKSQASNLWYDYYMALTYKDVSNVPQIAEVIDKAYMAVMSNGKAQLYHRKLTQDYLRDNPGASEEDAKNYAKKTIKEHIFFSAKRKVKVKHEEKGQPYFNNKPQEPGPGKGGKGPGAEKPPKIIPSVGKTTITEDGAEFLGTASPGAAAAYIRDENINLQNSGLAYPKSLGEVHNLNALGQYAFGVPVLGEDKHPAALGKANVLDKQGLLYQTYLSEFVPDFEFNKLTDQQKSEIWRTVPLIAQINNKSYDAVSLAWSAEAFFNAKETNDVIITKLLNKAAKESKAGRGSLDSGVMFALLAAQTKANSSSELTASDIDALVTERLQPFLTNYDASGHNRSYVSIAGFNESVDEHGNPIRKVGINETLQALHEYVNNIDMSAMIDLKPEARELLGNFKNTINAMVDNFNDKVLSNTAMVTKFNEIEERDHALRVKAAEMDVLNRAILHASGVKEDEFILIDNLPKNRNKDGKSKAGIDEDRREASKMVTAAKALALVDATGNWSWTNWSSAASWAETTRKAITENPALGVAMNTVTDGLISGNLYNNPKIANRVNGLFRDYFLNNWNLTKKTGKFDDYFDWSAAVVNSYGVDTIWSHTMIAVLEETGAYTDEQIKGMLNDETFMEAIQSTAAVGTDPFLGSTLKKLGISKDQAYALNLMFRQLNGAIGTPEKVMKGLGYLWNDAKANKMLEDLENNTAKITDFLFNGASIHADHGNSNKYIDALKNNLAETGAISSKGIKYYEEIAKSQLNREADLIFYKPENTLTEAGKQVMQNMKDTAKAALTNFSASGESVQRTLFGEQSAMENLNLQFLVDDYQAQLEGKTSMYSFNEYLDKSLEVQGIAYDVTHNASSPFTIVATAQINGRPITIQIPVEREMLNLQTMTAIGFPLENMQYGEQAHKSLDDNGNLYFELPIEGSDQKAKYYRAPVDLPGYGMNGEDIKAGQFYMINEGNSDWAMGEAKGRARVFKNINEAFNYHKENAAFGKYSKEISKLNAIIATAMRSPAGPDKWLETTYGKGFNLAFMKGKLEELLADSGGILSSDTGVDQLSPDEAKNINYNEQVPKELIDDKAAERYGLHVDEKGRDQFGLKVTKPKGFKSDFKNEKTNNTMTVTIPDDKDPYRNDIDKRKDLKTPEEKLEYLKSLFPPIDQYDFSADYEPYTTKDGVTLYREVGGTLEKHDRVIKDPEVEGKVMSTLNGRVFPREYSENAKKAFKANVHPAQQRETELKVSQIAQDLNIPPEWIYLLIGQESGWDTNSINRRSSSLDNPGSPQAAGLIQFWVGPDNNYHGYTAQQIQNMSPLKQLELAHDHFNRAISRHLKSQGKSQIDSFYEFYAINAYPPVAKRISSNDPAQLSHIIGSDSMLGKDYMYTYSDQNYTKNKYGVTTVNDMRRVMSKKANELLGITNK